MAGEFAIINPRRRRRRKRARARARVHNGPRRRRRRRVVAYANPRRRRYSRRRRHHTRRRHSNPRLLGGFGGLTSGLNTGLGIGLGIAGTEIATSAAIKYIPGIPVQLTTGIGRAALKVGVGGIAVPFLLKLVKQHGLARSVAIGAWAIAIWDLIHEYAAVPLGLGVYEQMEGYETLPAEGDAMGAIGAGENIYGDTMY